MSGPWRITWKRWNPAMSATDDQSGCNHGAGESCGDHEAHAHAHDAPAAAQETAPERTDHGVTDAACTEMVADFYRRVREDEVLGPWFNAVIKDWPSHEVTVADFWSRVIRGTERYRGCVFSSHGNLAMKPEHFTLWMAAFRPAVDATMPADVAPKIMAFAERLAEALGGGAPAHPPEGHPEGEKAAA